MARVDERSLAIIERNGGAVRGAIPVVDTIDGERVARLVPWHQAARQHSKAKGETEDRWALPDPTEVDVTEEVIGTLPPATFIPHRERYRILVRQLLQDRLATGSWPASVEADLRALGWKMGKPTLLQEVEALASRYIVEAANHQKNQDQHRVSVDHNGHYSA
jgi:hypothetical protein